MTALNYMIKQELYKGAPVNFSGTALKCIAMLCLLDRCYTIYTAELLNLQLASDHM